MENEILTFEEVRAKHPSPATDEYMKFLEEVKENKDEFFNEANEKVIELRDFILKYQGYLDDGPGTAADGYLKTRDVLVEQLSIVNKLIRDEYGRQLANDYLGMEF